MLPTRDSLQFQRHTESQNKGMEEMYHANEILKKGNYNAIVQSRLQVKNCNKR